jgi:hypothetical protein
MEPVAVNPACGGIRVHPRWSAAEIPPWRDWGATLKSLIPQGVGLFILRINFLTI